MSVEHFDLTGQRAIVLRTDNPAGAAIADAFEEAGALVSRIGAVEANNVADEVTHAAKQLGGLNILACAPDLFVAKPVTDITGGDLGPVMMVNFASQLFAIQAALPFIREHERGNIVLLTSVLGERGLPNTSIYSAAQGAVVNLVRALAQELAPEGISINAIELGWMDWMDDRIDKTDEQASRAVRFTMLKRPGKAEDIGPLAVWLAGDAVGFVTGQIFPVDGGLTQHL
ncbi:MAG TPA: SDR family oxidoreductase [Pseudomonadales bacterium]|nr:SDR family oxidoreductase [Pseudomonadales bacterium]